MPIHQPSLTRLPFDPAPAAAPPTRDIDPIAPQPARALAAPTAAAGQPGAQPGAGTVGSTKPAAGEAAKVMGALGLGELADAKAAPTPDPWTSVLIGEERLKAGSSGEAVQVMQEQLRAAGFKVPASGVYDEATTKAVKQFQATYHIQQTGEMGEQTSNGLAEVVAWRSVQTGKNILRPGDEGPAVTMLQRQLQRAGMKVELTGVFDEKTQALVNEVQQQNGWTPDGAVGPLTSGAIKSMGDPVDSGSDGKSHVPRDAEARDVYQDNQARLSKMQPSLSRSQEGELEAFLRNWDKNQGRYEAIEKKAGLPAELIAALHFREASANFGTYLHQGDPLGRPAVHWPTNIPVFHKWEEAAVHALGTQRGIQDLFNIDANTTDMAALSSYAEYYNGLGYYDKGKPSPYVFAGSNQYRGGKYVADGRYDPDHVDQQLGVATMLTALRDRKDKDQPAGAPDRATPRGEVPLTLAPRPWLDEIKAATGTSPAPAEPLPAPSTGGSDSATRVGSPTTGGSSSDGPAASKPPVAETPPEPTAKPAPGKAGDWRSVLTGGGRIRPGDSGPAVASLQQQLAAAGFPVPMTGQVDEATAAAITKFQSTYRIQTTGEVGAQTGNGLEEVAGFQAVQSGKSVLRPGDVSPAVSMMQRQLLRAGHKVQVTGIYDEATESAVKELQDEKGWVPDGAVGKLTTSALIADVNAVRAEEQKRGEDGGGISLSPGPRPWLDPDIKKKLADSPREAPKDEEAKYEYYREAIEARGHTFDTRPGQRNILGVRGWQNGKPTDNVKDRWNDTIAVLWVDAQGNEHVREYKSTVDPGSFDRFYNPAGDANLKDGQYQYVMGEHKGHRALNQGQAVPVWRDSNKDGIRSSREFEEKGWFGINVHAGGTGDRVGNWSAGCQVIWGGWEGKQWTDFMRQMDADPDGRYRYTLIDSSRMPKRSAIDDDGIKTRLPGEVTPADRQQ
jgi:peptidoglycan hydrolase-like protein with peptidoglycan-binding domain